MIHINAMNQFEGKVAIVTGSTKGIGKSLAEQLLLKGAKVVLNGRDETRLLETSAELKQKGYEVLAIPGDVSMLEDCKKMVEQTIQHYGRIDLLINNAGVNMRGRVEDIQPEALRMVMDINFMGALYMTRFALPVIESNQGGIVFISSAAGIHGLPQYAVYSASKMALTALAESLRAELYGTNTYVGIAYVGLTENEKGKTIYNEKGEKIPKVAFDAFGLQPIETVATEILRMVERRQPIRVLTFLGKLNLWINRLIPPLAHYIITKAYYRSRW